jgi:hypothetical protein
MLSTVPDLAQFVIAQLDHGQFGPTSVLSAESVTMMQRPAATFSVGQGDLNQSSYGLGLGQIRRQPWTVWGHPYDMHGAVGHGGSWFGYQSAMWFVPEDGGGYGIVLLSNTECDFKPEARDLWLFASPLRLQVLLMAEARTRYEAVRRG